MPNRKRAKAGRPAAATAILVLLCLMLSWTAQPALAGDPQPAAQPQELQTVCTDGVQASGAQYRLCKPFFPPWNGDLLVYAHGYVQTDKPVAIPEDQLRLPDGTYLPDALGLMGYAFAVTSYSTNGLAVREALADLQDLVSIFKAANPSVKRIYLIGVSEGGLIAALSAEQFPQVYSGVAATCGPIGDFRLQVNHFGDFRVVFDYFFPGLIPGSATEIPPDLLLTWSSYYPGTVLPAIKAPASQISVTQLLNVTGAPVDPLNSQTISETIGGLLWYSIFATNDAGLKLGGQPFDNHDRVYTGSLDDTALNDPVSGVARFTADPIALANIRFYQTTGRPLVPLVTGHTTGDPIVPYQHEILYRAKVVLNNRTPRHDNIRIERYGHCQFNALEVQTALTLLQSRVMNPPLWQAYLPLSFKR